MRALQIMEPGQSRIVDVEIPAVGENEVLVKIVTAATCPRWDINMFTGHDMFDLEKTPSYPLPPGFPGHEAAGFVEAVGPRVQNFRVGDRVVSLEHPAGDGAYAEYMCYQPSHLMKLPDSITFEQATSFELLKCVVIALQQFVDLRAKTMLIAGLGPAGLLAAQVAKHWGASRVVGVDVSSRRLEFARSLGLEAMHTNDLDSLGFDLGMDCVGFAASVQNVLDHAAEHVVVFGVSHGDVIFREEWWGKGKRLEVYRYRPFTQRDCDLMIDLVVNKGLDTECLYTHRIPFSRYDEVIETLRGQDAIKVLFYPEQDLV